jgi:hypothetical protein
MMELKATPEQVNNFYEAYFVKTEKPDSVNRIIDAAKDATGGQPELLADAMFQLADTRQIPKADVEQKLGQFRQHTAEAQAEAKAKKAKEAQKQKATDIKAQADQYIAAIDKGDKSALAESLAAISKEAAGLVTTATTRKSPIVSYAEYRQRRTDRKYWEEFTPALFNRLPFPDGSINLIGARSGAGKTNALVNIMRELLTTAAPNAVANNTDKEQAKNADRRMVFVSREMTIDDILDRLALSLAWTLRHTFPCLKNLNKNPFFNMQQFHTSQNYPDTPPEDTFKAYSHILENIISPAMKSGRLVMLDAIEAETLEEILLNLTRLDIRPGDAVLIDYIQLLPATTNEEAERYATADHLRMRYIVHELRKAAKESGAVFICAAQLNREAAKNQAEGKTNIETAFKDSADLEQAAHSAVIIDRKDGDADNPPELSYHVVKARSSYHLGQHYGITWNPGFYHMELGIEKTGKKKKIDSPETHSKPLNAKERKEKMDAIIGVKK